MKGSASGDVIRHLYPENKPFTDGLVGALCLRTLTPLSTITVRAAVYLSPRKLSICVAR